jgi:hypothetical protein
MAYRGEPARDVCARHPAAGARARCASCAAALCECCVLFDGIAPCCHDCRARRQRRRRVARIGAATVGAFLLVAGAFAVRSGAAQARAQLVTRQLEHRIRVLDAAVAVNRCAVADNAALVAALNEHGDSDAAAEVARDYCFQCSHLQSAAPWPCPTTTEDPRGLASLAPAPR